MLHAGYANIFALVNYQSALFEDLPMQGVH